MNWLWILPAVAVVVYWFLWVTRGTEDADDNGLSYRLHRAWRRTAFWAGDVHFSWQWYFGFIPLPHLTWAKHEYDVTYEELLEACKLCEPGDVFLATKNGYIFSNSAIPGCFKHAGVVTKTGIERIVIDLETADGSRHRACHDLASARIVEAVSEGVIERHMMYARGDLMIILRPKHQEPAERDRAAATALKLVGCEYDVNFDFNVEEELEWLNGQRSLAGASFDAKSEKTLECEEDHSACKWTTKERDMLQTCKCNIRAEFDVAFSCTEVAAAAWWFRHEQLGITRKKVRGRMCIVADQFVNRDFHVVWTNVDEEIASRHGLHEEGVNAIGKYWAERWAKRRGAEGGKDDGAREGDPKQQ